MNTSNVNKSVMIVDDDEDVRSTFKAMLEDCYSIIEVSGGRECLEKLQTWKPDLILLDIMMPEMDGWQVLEKIRENHALKNIPVVIISAQADIKIKSKEIAAYSKKPVSRDALLNTIENIFNLNMLGEPKIAII